MKFKSEFTCNSMLEVIISQSKEVIVYDELVNKVNSIPLSQGRFFHQEFEEIRELEKTIPVQIMNDFRALRKLMGKECNDMEWEHNFLTIQISVNDICKLPNRSALDDDVRAWFYLQLFYIKNGRCDELNLSEEQKNKLFDLEIAIINNPKLEELHNTYMQYYTQFLSHYELSYAHQNSLIHFREVINKIIASQKQINDTDIRLTIK